MRQVVEDLHPNFSLYDVSFPVLERQPVRGRADRGRANDVALHLDALGRRARRHGPIGRRTPVEAQWSDRAGVEVSQLPRRAVQLLRLQVRPLVHQVVAVAEQPPGFLVLRLRFHLERLTVLVGQAVLRLLDLLVQGLAQLPTQLAVRQTPLAARLRTLTLFLGLAPSLAAGPRLRGAAVGVVTVANRSSDAGAQQFVPGVVFLSLVFGVHQSPPPLYGHPEVGVRPLLHLLSPPRSVLVLFCPDAMQEFGEVRLFRLFLLETEKTEKFDDDSALNVKVNYE